MKKILLSISMLFIVCLVNAQQNKQDATSKIKALIEMKVFYISILF